MIKEKQKQLLFTDKELEELKNIISKVECSNNIKSKIIKSLSIGKQKKYVPNKELCFDSAFYFSYDKKLKSITKVKDYSKTLVEGRMGKQYIQVKKENLYRTRTGAIVLSTVKELEKMNKDLHKIENEKIKDKIEVKKHTLNLRIDNYLFGELEMNDFQVNVLKENGIDYIIDYIKTKEKLFN